MKVFEFVDTFYEYIMRVMWNILNSIYIFRFLSNFTDTVMIIYQSYYRV